MEDASSTAATPSLWVDIHGKAEVDTNNRDGTEDRDQTRSDKRQTDRIDGTDRTYRTD